jgi:hypothetical protein
MLLNKNDSLTTEIVDSYLAELKRTGRKKTEAAMLKDCCDILMNEKYAEHLRLGRGHIKG